MRVSLKGTSFKINKYCSICLDLGTAQHSLTNTNKLRLAVSFSLTKPLSPLSIASSCRDYYFSNPLSFSHHPPFPSFSSSSSSSSLHHSLYYLIKITLRRNTIINHGGVSHGVVALLFFHAFCCLPFCLLQKLARHTLWWRLRALVWGQQLGHP